MSQKDDFLRLFLKYNGQLYSFIYTLVPNHADAEDFLQETASTLWQKIDEFEDNSNFLAWAKRVAKYKILNFYTKIKEGLILDEGMIDKIARCNEKLLEQHDLRKAAVQGCLKKMDINNIRLILLRYHHNLSLKKIAEQTGMSVNTLYKKMSMLLSSLRDCVHKTLLSWE